MISCIIVDDELTITDTLKLRLLDSLNQAERGETFKVSFVNF